MMAPAKNMLLSVYASFSFHGVRQLWWQDRLRLVNVAVSTSDLVNWDVLPVTVMRTMFVPTMRNGRMSNEMLPVTLLPPMRFTYPLPVSTATR